MVRKVVKMGMCHLLGDYFFQSEYIADTKGKNWYHLFIHCVLYSFPFVYFMDIKSKWCIFLFHILLLTRLRPDTIKLLMDRISVCIT